MNIDDLRKNKDSKFTSFINKHLGWKYSFIFAMLKTIKKDGISVSGIFSVLIVIWALWLFIKGGLISYILIGGYILIYIVKIINKNRNKKRCKNGRRKKRITW